MNLQYGNLVYSEKRNLKKARRKLYSIGLIFYILIALLLCIGLLISLFSMLILLLLLSPLLYIATSAIIQAKMGMRNLQVYEKGFIRPLTYKIVENIRGEFFIPFDAIKCIFTNPYIRRKFNWAYITVIMKDGRSSFAIETRDISNLTKFLSSVKRDVQLVERDFLIGKYYQKYVDYYPPHAVLIISTEGVSLRYKDQIKDIPFNEIKKISTRHPGLIQLKENNYRIGIFELSGKQAVRVKEAFQNFRKENA